MLGPTEDPHGLATVIFSYVSSPFSTQSWRSGIRSGQDTEYARIQAQGLGGVLGTQDASHAELVLCVSCPGPRATPLAAPAPGFQNLTP